ncbi:hypothetical protein HHI36_008650 [Cryptolaemus montrouzieri]|uniref:Uncharacterized protein n=1 Tax=Cryptolaemus montrouzieri TaxID=559131 RepID=A0ABD2MT67_9CUCU
MRQSFDTRQNLDSSEKRTFDHSGIPQFACSFANLSSLSLFLTVSNEICTFVESASSFCSILAVQCRTLSAVKRSQRSSTGVVPISSLSGPSSIFPCFVVPINCS